MKNLRTVFALALVLACSIPLAEGYNCSAKNSPGGGWTPTECAEKEQTTAASISFGGYSCPSEKSSAGGWLPLECVKSNKAVCAECGTIEAVNVVETSDATGLGAVAGAVAGGVVGNKVGKKGKGKTLATVIGAVGGGVAGHYGEKYLGKKKRWDVVILMDDGTHRTISFDTAPDYEPGDKVRISGSNLIRQ